MLKILRNVLEVLLYKKPQGIFRKELFGSGGLFEGVRLYSYSQNIITTKFILFLRLVSILKTVNILGYIFLGKI